MVYCCTRASGDPPPNSQATVSNNLGRLVGTPSKTSSRDGPEANDSIFYSFLCSTIEIFTFTSDLRQSSAVCQGIAKRHTSWERKCDWNFSCRQNEMLRKISKRRTAWVTIKGLVCLQQTRLMRLIPGANSATVPGQRNLQENVLCRQTTIWTMWNKGFYKVM